MSGDSDSRSFLPRFPGSEEQHCCEGECPRKCLVAQKHHKPVLSCFQVMTFAFVVLLLMFGDMSEQLVLLYCEFCQTTNTIYIFDYIQGVPEVITKTFKSKKIQNTIFFKPAMLCRPTIYPPFFICILEVFNQSF